MNDTQQESSLKALIVGLGGIGRRHLENLKRIEPDANISVWRRRLGREKAAGAAGADRVIFSAKEAAELKPDVALICSPASRHMEPALMLARQGSHLFIEKPLSDTLDDVDELLAVCRANDSVLMVGYNFRFHEPLLAMRQALNEGRIGRVLAARVAVGQYLPDWRPGKNYEETASAKRKLGGGAVLELSHELDYTRWLIGEVEMVRAEAAHISDLRLDVEDIAEIIVRFTNGVIGSIHLDMIDRAATRACRIIGSEGTLTWDGVTDGVRLFRADSGDWIDLYTPVPAERNDMYLSELRHFIECVRERKKPVVSGEDGRRVLEIALAVKRSSEERRVVEV